MTHLVICKYCEIPFKVDIPDVVKAFIGTDYRECKHCGAVLGFRIEMTWQTAEEHAASEEVPF